MQALSESTDPARASIPFDKDRQGFVMSEGAEFMLLESEEHAKMRGAKILGQLAGYAAESEREEQEEIRQRVSRG
jgi:3-oxoacyl-[acyl-carrier-protein] synthase II